MTGSCGGHGVGGVRDMSETTPARANARTAAGARLRDAAFVTLAYALLALSMLAANRLFAGGSMVWLAGGLLLGCLLRRGGVAASWWLPPCLLVVDAGIRALWMQSLAGSAPASVLWPLAAALAAADMAEVMLAGWLLRRSLMGDGGIAFHRLAAGVGAAAVLAPAIGASVAAVALQQFAGQPLRDTAVAWWGGHLLGLLALTPAIVAWNRGRLRALLAARSRAFWGALLVLLLAASLPAWSAIALGAQPWPLVPLTVVLVASVLLFATSAVGGFGSALLGCCAALAVPVFTAIAGSAGNPSAGLSPVVAGLAVALLALAPLLASVLLEQRDAAVVKAQLAEQRLQALVERTPGLVAQLGRDLRYRFANRGFLQWHGLDEEQVVGRATAEIFEPALAARLDSRMNRALAGQAQQFDLAMPDGRELRTRLEPQFDADGSVDGFYLLAEDVSWRGQGARRFEAMLEAAEALLVIGAGGRITQANAAAAHLFGLEPDALLQRPLAELLGAASATQLQQALQDARTQPSASIDPLHLSARRGDDEFPLQIRLTSLPGDNGAQIAASLRDLGPELGLGERLQHQQALAQVMLDAVNDAVIACDAQARIVAFNPVAETLTGWTREDACGLPLQQVLRMVGAEPGSAPPSPLELALQDNREVHLQPEAALLRRDGEKMPIEASALPVRDADGNVVGAVMAFHDLSETRATAMKMSHLAQHDYLTDLPNRVLLRDRLSQALAAAERGSKGALLFVDLDFFKKINDTLGHQAGDKVLQEVARRLVDAVRADDTVSRQGGDEFVLLLVRLADPRDAARVAEKLILAVEQPFHVEGQVLHISASVGIALFPQDARDIKTLMTQADTALYHAKEAGRGRYSYFTGVMSERADQRMRVEHDLRFALANEDFFLAYQPKVRLPEGRITGMEALVRWRRSDNGQVVAPDDFIPVAEETGLITALDEWVMREACRQNRAWQDAGIAPVPVSVNVSLARFDPERVLAHVRATLAETGMAPQWLEIEFTESQMFTHLERAQELIARLKELGVKVAMDDFGTGYSSLGYLVRYKFDALKIDRSFVQGLPDDPKHSAIVQAIVAMARALDYRVIAEGVEDQSQADALLRHGCHEMQGYLYSRPLPAAEFVSLLQRGTLVAPPLAPVLSREA